MQKKRRIYKGFVALMVSVIMLMISAFPADVYAQAMTEVNQDEILEAVSEADTAEEVSEETTVVEGSDGLNEDPGMSKAKGDVSSDFYGTQTGKSGQFTFSTASTYGSIANDTSYRAKKGIDISQWQGNIDWAAVKASGIEFAIIRVAFRYASTAGDLGTDTQALKNLQAAKAAGLEVGAYIYSQATTKEEAEAEAAYAINVVKQSGVKLDIPVVMDFEYYSSGGVTTGRLYKANLTKDQATNVCLGFIRKAKALGYKSMVYANRSMLNSRVNAETLAKEAEIWLAEWQIATPGYTGTFTYWQYSNCGTVPGIYNNVDMDYHYVPVSGDGSGGTSSSGGDTIKERSETVEGKTVTYTPMDATDGQTMVKVTMRKGPSAEFGTLIQIPAYKSVTITGESGKWYRVTYQSGTTTYSGYIPQNAACFESEIPAKVTQHQSFQTRSKIKLRWKAVSGASKYRIYRYNYEKGKYEFLADAAGTATYYYDTSVKPDTTYKYIIRAYKVVKGREIYGSSSNYRMNYTSGKTGTVNTIYGLNVRKKINGVMAVVGVLDYKEKVTYYKTSGNYYLVLYDHDSVTKRGYVSKDYITLN